MAGLAGLSRRRQTTPVLRRRFVKQVDASVLVLLTAATGLAAGPDGTGQAVTPAVGIRTPPLLSPAEMASAGMDPEVELKIDIDEAGVVSRVQVLAIEPSTRFDDLLRSAVTEGLKRWRYGPARDAEDNPVPSSMSWRMKFLSADSRSRTGLGALDVKFDQERRTLADFDSPSLTDAGGTSLNPFTDLRALAGADSLPPNYRPLTRQERAERLSEVVESAEKYIDRNHRRRSETQRFIVISDAEEASTADTLAGNMESVFGVFHSIFDEHIQPMPQNWKLVVYLYRRQDSLKQLNQDVGGRAFSNGFYRSPGLLAFHQEVQYYDQLLSTMLHEAFHAFSDSHLTAPGKQLPRWAEEGLAEYFGHSRIEDGRLVTGERNRGRYVVPHGRSGPVRLQSGSVWSVREARLALRQGEAPSIVELIDASADTFYGERYQVFYGFSWLFTHFLRHGREAWESDGTFVRLLLYLTEEYASRDALQTAYGLQPEELQNEFERYVKRF